jgi:hypothetical protein
VKHIVPLCTNYILGVKMVKTEKKSKAGAQKKLSTRILKLVLLLIVVLTVLVFLLVPVFMSSEKGRRLILSRINNSIDGQIDFTNLSMGWLKGVRVADFSFNDSVGQISAQVKQITTKPHYCSIVMGNLSFGETTIDQPKVNVNLKGQPEVEQELVGKAEPVPAKAGYVALAMDIAINDGNLKVTDSRARTVELSEINSRLNLRPPGEQSNLDLTMAIAQAGKTSEIQVAGSITPKKQTGWSLKGATGDLTVEVNDLDIESLGPFLALAGVEIHAKGLVRGQIKGQIKDGLMEKLNADVKAKDLDITGAALKGDRLQTGDLEINATLNQGKETIDIQNLQIKSDWASASASGIVPTTFMSLDNLLDAKSDYNLKGKFNCDLAVVSSQIPKTLGLKEGMKLTSGQLNGSIDTSTKAGGQKQIQANATITALEGTVDGKKIALSQPIETAAQISSDKAGINFDKVGVSSSFAKINCAGSSKSLKYTAQADIAKLQAELGQFVDFGQYKMSGEVQEMGLISIEEDKIAISGSGTVKNLNLSSEQGQSASEPAANIEYAINMDKKNNLVNVESVIADASMGRLRVKDSVIPLNKDSIQPLRIDVSASNFDLAKIKPFAVMFGLLPKDTQLAGIAESEVKVTSEKDTYHIVTEKTNIKNIEFSTPGKKPFKEPNSSIVADVSLNPTNFTYSGKLAVLVGQIKMILNLSNQNKENQTSELKGNAELEYDWSAVSAIAAPYLPEGLTLQGERKDTVSFVSEYPSGQTDKLLANLTSNAKLGFERAGYMGLDFGPTDVDIQMQKGLLNIPPFITTVNEGQFNFAGQADFRQKPATLKMAKPLQLMKDIKINDQTTKELLRYVNPIFADAVNVSGIANFRCEQLIIPFSAAAKKQAEVVGTISMDKVRLQASDLLGQILTAAGTSARGADITIRPTKFVLRDGFLRYDDMQMDVGDNPVNFKGVIGLDKSLDMTVTLPYTALGRTIRIGQETSSQRIQVPLKGTVDKPKLDLGKLLEGQLRQQLEDQLRKGLEELLK